LAWRVDVQGANGPVKKQRAFKIDGMGYAPAQIIYPTTEDTRTKSGGSAEKRSRKKC
jgi:hypothetical protein